MASETLIGMVTILGIAGALVWYFGRTAALKAVLGGTAWMLRADKMAVFEPEAMLDYTYSENRDAFLGWAIDEDSPVLPNDALQIAGYHNGASDLIWHAINTVAKPGTQAEALDESGLGDQTIEELIEMRDMWPDPIDTVAKLDDDPGAAYAWILREGATENDRVSITREIEEAFIKGQQREPQALHFLVDSIEEIRDIEADTIRKHIKPWLRGNEHRDKKEREGE